MNDFITVFIFNLVHSETELLFYILQETLHIHKKYEMESPSYVPDVEEKTYDEKDSILISLLKNWQLMSSIIVYCVFSLHDMAYSEVSLKYDLIILLISGCLCFVF